MKCCCVPKTCFPLWDTMPNSPNGQDEDAALQKGPRRKPSASLQPPHIQPFSENEVKFRTISSKHKCRRTQHILSYCQPSFLRLSRVVVNQHLRGARISHPKHFDVLKEFQFLILVKCGEFY